MRKTIFSIYTLFCSLVFFLGCCFFSSAAFAADLTLAWDSNSESDLAGYKVYYKTGSSGAPYDGTGADQGSSGIEVPLEDLDDSDNPIFTLSGLSENTVYYLAVTAYNEQGSESGYSNEVNHLVEPVVNMYTITSSAGSGGSITPSGATTVSQDSSQVYNITSEAGYHVADVLVDGSSAGAVSSYTFNNVTTNHTITASFEINTHTITATSGSGGSISPSGTTAVSQGSSLTYTITPDAGYHVADVMVDGVSANVETSYTVNPVDGSSMEGSSTYTFSNITADHTISASFAMDTHTITATAGAGGSISPAGTTTVAQGSSRTCTITPNAGYHLLSVTVDGVSARVETSHTVNSVDGSSSEGSSTYTFSNITADHTISASFEINTHTITATAGEHGSISPAGTISLNHGNRQVYIITPETGYHVADVLVDGISVGAGTSYSFSSVAANHTISVSFEIDTVSYTITAASGANGSISPSGTTTVAQGSSQIYTITPDADCTVADVQIDGVSAGAVTTYTFSNVTENHLIEASFKMGNQPPDVDAGPDQTVDEGILAALNGSNSFDLDDGIKSFKWEQTGGTTVVLSTPDEAECSFLTPDVGQNGEAFTFRLSVTDYSGAVSTDICIINVTWVNEVPVANAGPDLNVNEGDIVTLDAAQSFDEDDGIGSYQWIQIEGSTVTLSDPTAVSPDFTPPDVGPAGAVLKFRLTVADHGGLQARDTCIVNVSWQNQPPVSDAGADKEVEGGSVVTLDGTGSADTDDGISLYRWNQTSGTPVTLSDPTSVSPFFTAPSAGPDGETLNFTLTVTDAGGLQHSDTCAVAVRSRNMDTTSPTVRITSPRIRWYWYFTRKSSITVAGNALDNLGISRVTWRNSRGGSGTASGTAQWEVKGLSLQRGFNVVTITAEDEAGNQSSQAINIYRLR